LQREVAIKVPHAQMVTTPDLRARFQREARIASGLNHPHIVPVYEAGQVGPVCFIVTALCRGVTLGQWLKARIEPVAFADAVRLIASLADAVQYAHEKGIIHRDLKPANVLLCSEEIAGAGDATPPTSTISLNTAQITDFGLAKNVRDPDLGNLTRSGAILGTVNYMPPEQAAGRGAAARADSDIYALGAIFYELLAGRPPFQGATDLETLQKIQFEDSVPPQRLRPQVPRDLATICLKCLSKEGTKRYASARELAEDLRRYLADLPILARRSTVWDRLARHCRRYPVSSSLAAAVAVLLIILAAFSQLAARRYGIQRDKALAAELAVKKELLSSYLVQSRASRRGGHAGRRFDTLATIERAVVLKRELGDVDGIPTPLDFRNEMIGCLALADLKIDAQWEGYPAGSEQLTLAPDFTRYARSNYKGGIQLCRVGDGQELASLPAESEAVKALRISPDSRWVAFVREGLQLQLWNVEKETRSRPEIPPTVATAIAFDKASRVIAVGHADGTISLYDLVEETRTRTLKFATGAGIDALHFDPAGRWLAASVGPKFEVRLANVATDEVAAVLPLPSKAPSLAVSADGMRAAIACNDGRLRIWEVGSGGQTRELTGHRSVVQRVAIDPTGTLVASWSWDGTLRLWDADSGAELFRTAADVRELRFSEDGLRLASGIEGTSVQVWRVAHGIEHRVLNCNDGPRVNRLGDCSVSPDGRRLAVAGTWGTVLWDLVTGARLGVAPSGGTRSVAFSSRGEDLITAGNSGLWRWPIRPNPGSTTISFAAGQRLREASTQHLRPGAGGDLLAVAIDDRGVSILPLAELTAAAPVLEHKRTVFSAVSRTGRWVASGTWYGNGVRVWDRETGVQSDLLKEDRMATVCFSPDDRWLVTGGIHEFCIWETGTWRLHRRVPRTGGNLPGNIAFAPAGGILALQTGLAQIRFVDPDTVQEFCTIDIPDGESSGPIAFLPDGSGFVSVASLDGHVHLWDLALIRRQLASLGLDWDSAAGSR
jgi:WD40 repeat protein